MICLALSLRSSFLIYSLSSTADSSRAPHPQLFCSNRFCLTVVFEEHLSYDFQSSLNMIKSSSRTNFQSAAGLPRAFLPKLYGSDYQVVRMPSLCYVKYHLHSILDCGLII